MCQVITVTSRCQRLIIIIINIYRTRRRIYYFGEISIGLNADHQLIPGHYFQTLIVSIMEFTDETKIAIHILLFTAKNGMYLTLYSLK